MQKQQKILVVINKILNGLKAQNHKYIAKAISIIENKDSQSSELLNDIFPVISNTIKIGITGPPGAGKSSITNHLIKKYRSVNAKKREDDPPKFFDKEPAALVFKKKKIYSSLWWFSW